MFLSSHSIVCGLLASCLFAGSVGADVKPPPESAVSVTKPTVEGTGPYTVTFTGVATVEQKAKAFHGVRMTVRSVGAPGAGDINTLVSMPEASPKPGETRPVEFAATLPRGTYTGVVEMLYTDTNGKPRTVKFDVPKFEVPGK